MSDEPGSGPGVTADGSKPTIDLSLSTKRPPLDSLSIGSGSSPDSSATMSPDLQVSPISPTFATSSTDRKQVRRRKKLKPTDAGASPSGPSSDQFDASKDQPTGVSLPPEISLPITIKHIFVPDAASQSLLASLSGSRTFTHQQQSDSMVLKTTPLFSYLEGVVEQPYSPLGALNHDSTLNPTSALKGKHRAVESHSRTPDLPDHFDHLQDTGPALAIYESPIKGEVTKWFITEGQVLEEKAGWSSRPLLLIKEPCTHSVQWQGQCAICGSDLTISDYTGISETSRANIPMSHGPSTLTVSILEAQRLESETRRRLLKDEKLSLIVDLDQTIVHATVDPTVGEWMSDPKNPNWSALQGVGRFQLHDGPSVDNSGCYYYLKMRPGLPEFLRTLAQKYEMHVYTMGTRAYADAVCRIIDPTGELFGNRVLSRDESGSMTQKSLTRLFPVDTSMVVIIDDRGDVWEYSPNLVSVVPYNFFVGIGDINGAFLPPAGPGPLQPSTLSGLDQNSTSLNGGLSTPTMTLTKPSGSSAIVDIPGSNTLPDPEAVLVTQPIPVTPSADTVPASQPSEPTHVASIPITPVPDEVASSAQSKLLTDQVLSRPLKQKQIELEEAQRGHKSNSHRRINSAESSGPSAGSSKSNRTSRAATPVATSPCPAELKAPDGGGGAIPAGPEQKSSESNTDNGSDEASTSLVPDVKKSEEAIADDGNSETDVNTDGGQDDHDEYPHRAVLVDQDTELTRLGSILSDVHAGFYSQDFIEQADVREVISALKHDVLQGVHLAFSGLWPMDAIPDQQDAWKLAEQFGAHCYPKLTPRVTHLVAAKLGTSKVNIALTRRNLSVVNPKWLYDAVTLWTQPTEEDYLWKTTSLDEDPPEEIEIEDDHDGWGAGMAEFDWKDAAEEVMAALEESDGETTGGGGTSSEDGTAGRKRGRTTSSSSLLRSRNSSRARSVETDSPLSKRQRLARSRSSKLKLMVGAGQNEPGPPSSDAGYGESEEVEEEVDEEIVAEGRRKPIELSAEEDEFLSALAAEFEGEMA